MLPAFAFPFWTFLGLLCCPQSVSFVSLRGLICVRFNISLMPYFSLSFALSALYLGLGLAVPSIRGGGEYGIEWYKAAIKSKKQVGAFHSTSAKHAVQSLLHTQRQSPGKTTQVCSSLRAGMQVSYDDFQRAAEHLFEKGYSSPNK